MSRKKIYLTYKDIEEDIKILAKNILNSSVRYDAIVAISGGGLIPGRMLRNYINLPIYCVNIKTYNENNQQNNDVKIVQWFGKNEITELSTKNILFIDDLDDTRNTLYWIIKLINDENEGLNCNKVGFGLLYNKLKKKSYKIPDEFQYYTAKDIEDKWVVFPWEIYN